jgi:hypothetical protein
MGSYHRKQQLGNKDKPGDNILKPVLRKIFLVISTGIIWFWIL